MQSEREIHIRGFLKTTNVNELRQFFNEYKSIQDVRIIYDYAFIDFKQKADADRAVNEKNGKIFQGKALKIEKALHPQSLRTPKPTDKCNQCGKLGHWKRDCPNMTQPKRKRDISQSNYKRQVKSRSRDRERERERDRINNDKHKSKRKRYERSSNSSSPDSCSKSSYERSRCKYQKSHQKSKNKKKQKR